MKKSHRARQRETLNVDATSIETLQPSKLGTLKLRGVCKRLLSLFIHKSLGHWIDRACFRRSRLFEFKNNICLLYFQQPERINSFQRKVKLGHHSRYYNWLFSGMDSFICAVFSSKPATSV